MLKTESGKEYVFKSPHDQATFEISKRIWGGVVGGNNSAGGFNTPVKISRSPDEAAFNDEEDEIRDNNASLNFSSGLIDFTPNVAGVDEKVPIRPKKRVRVSGGGGVGNVVNAQFNQPQTPMSIGAGDQGVLAVATPNVIEETIKSCVSPIFKELLNGVMNLSNVARGAGGLAALGNMTLGLGFGGIGGGGLDLAAAGDERWKKQQILELEVFSKRLELVQDQIKVQLEELRGKGS
ncbi:hypothetical protein LIER_13450 [Lithospermum erythrorhizon]|uniref:Uncharacterized protein n=1 Tax=Lithospermum erythrorhizon TaxID=34254 RepID=A0AAV3PXZ6_LITER